MKVVVVGAGIGGLSAAIALNREGHDVEVYEGSSFLNEVGAAIHVATNASRFLEKWGCEWAALDPVDCHRIKAVDGSDLSMITNAVDIKKIIRENHIKYPYIMAHRVDLHNHLRYLAAEKGYQGRRAKIFLDSKVDSVDAEAGEVRFMDGRTVKGDLVIGADGLHSRTVQAILPTGRTKVSTGQIMFRFLVPTEKAESDPSVKALIHGLGFNTTSTLALSSSSSSSDDDSNKRNNKRNARMTIYPCRGGRLLNCGVVVKIDEEEEDPAAAAAARETSWLDPGSVDHLLAHMDGFHESVRRLCGMAEDVKLWSLSTRDPPPTFVRGKLVLIGDAAHPMLPHLGQGGAQAIEDAGTLGALFAPGTTTAQVADLLEIYNRVRYRHTVTLCIASRTPIENHAAMVPVLRRFIPFPDGSNPIPDDLWWRACIARPDEEVARELETRGVVVV